MVINKLMYERETLAWYQNKCDDLEIRQNGKGVENVRNELIRGETGWSTLEDRKAKVIVKWMLRVMFEDNFMSEIGIVCLIETGCKLRWWSRCRHICYTYVLMELVNVILLSDVSVNGMVSLGINVDRKVWRKYIRD